MATISLKDDKKRYIKKIRVGEEDYDIRSAKEEEYEKIFKKWFPDSELTPESLAQAPKRIIKETLELLAAEEIDLCLKNVYQRDAMNRKITGVIVPYLKDDAIATMGLVREHVLKLKNRFNLDEENIVNHTSKIINKYLSPCAEMEVTHFFLTSYIGITNRFLMDMEAHKEILQHTMLMESFDEMKKGAEEYSKTSRDTDGDTPGLIHIPEEYWASYLTKEDVDKSLKYRRLFMGDWSVAGREPSGEKEVKEDLKDLVKSYYRTEEE